ARHDDHRAPHSFPTRRSSDLVVERGNPGDVDHVVDGRVFGGDVRNPFYRAFNAGYAYIDRGYAALITRMVSRSGVMVIVALAIRSEEHTSELQSLTNLVCRLL